MIQNVALESHLARIGRRNQWKYGEFHSERMFEQGTSYLDGQITRRLFLLYRQNTCGILTPRVKSLSLADSRAMLARAIKDMIGGSESSQPIGQLDGKHVGGLHSYVCRGKTARERVQKRIF